jgi:hypothetical protein
LMYVFKTAKKNCENKIFSFFFQILIFCHHFLTEGLVLKRIFSRAVIKSF